MANYNSFCFEGHGLSEVTGAYDPGAVNGNFIENKIAEKIVNAAKSYLDGTSLKIHYDENNYEDNDLKGNSYSSKSGIVVHINAGKGSGVEIYVPSKEKYLTTDFEIVDRLSKLLSIPNRGVKSRDYDSEATFKRANGVALPYRDYYKEIRVAWEQGISLSLLEVGFIDTNDIYKIMDNIDKIGFEVARYVAKNCDVDLKEPSKSVESSKKKIFYRVIAGSFSNRSRAEARKKDLEIEGYDGVFLEAKEL